jgi:predicted dehydrogenase
MVTDDSLDGIVIMTPNSTHCELAVAALRAGKHVLVTKPLATTLADAAAMIAAAKEGGRVLSVGHQSRRHPALRRLKTLVDSGALGTPRLIEGNTSSPSGFSVTAGDWRSREAECPGGPLMQLGIHYIDNFQHLLGPVRTVSAWMSRTAASAVDPDTTMTLIGFDAGSSGYLGSSYVTSKARWIRVSGEEASATFAADGSLTVSGKSGELAEVIVPASADRDAVLQQMMAEEIAEFAACIRNNRRPENTAEAGARNLAVVLAAVESHRRSASVVVDELLTAAGLSL